MVVLTSSPQEPVKTAGFYNVGNSCYINVVLQTLLHTEMFVDWLRAHEKFHSSPACLACAIGSLLIKHVSLEGQVPQKVLDIVPNIRGGFNVLVQSDAQEFLLAILGHLNDEHTDDRPLRTLFGVDSVIKGRCMVCSFSPIPEERTDYFIPIFLREGVSIQDAIENHFKPSQAYASQCFTCDAHSVAYDTVVTRLPKILQLQINRTQLSTFLKNAMPVQIDKSIKVCGQEFSIKSIIFHSGASLNCGHYTFAVLRREEKILYYDDHLLYEFGQDFLQTDYARHNGYVLFYQRCDETQLPVLPLSHAGSLHRKSPSGSFRVPAQTFSEVSSSATDVRTASLSDHDYAARPSYDSPETPSDLCRAPISSDVSAATALLVTSDATAPILSADGSLGTGDGAALLVSTDITSEQSTGVLRSETRRVGRKRGKWKERCCALRCLTTNLTEGVRLFPFPKPWIDLNRCLRWIRATGRIDLGTAAAITKHTYLCGLHWSSRNGPTVENPDPDSYNEDEPMECLPVHIASDVINHGGIGALQTARKKVKRSGNWKECCCALRCLTTNLSEGVTLYPFPKPWIDLDRCSRWIRATGRLDLRTTDVSKHTYLCGLHWPSKNGPTEESPEPKDFNDTDQVPVPSQSDYMASLQRSLSQNYADEELGVSNLPPMERERNSPTHADEPYTLKLKRKETLAESRSGSFSIGDEPYFNFAESRLSNLFLDATPRKHCSTPISNAIPRHESCFSRNDLSPIRKVAATDKTSSQSFLSATGFLSPSRRAARRILRKSVRTLPSATIQQSRLPLIAARNSQQSTVACQTVVHMAFKMSYEICVSEKQFQFLCGLNIEHFDNLLQFIGDEKITKLLKYKKQGMTPKRERPDRRKLSLRSKLFLTLVRLRRGFKEEELAYLFGVSQTTVSRVCRSWIQLMFKCFRRLRPFMIPSAAEQQHKRPACFERFKDVRLISDCTEVRIETPSNFNQQGNQFSAYKHHGTVKFCVCITLRGAICHISEAFEGGASDKVVFLNSGIMEYLVPGDAVMVDRGFHIDNELAAKGVRVICPPFLKKSGRINAAFTAKEAVETAEIASARIHVERSIGSIKKWNILRTTVPQSLLPLISQMFYVCASLCNYSPLENL